MFQLHINVYKWTSKLRTPLFKDTYAGLKVSVKCTIVQWSLVKVNQLE